MTRISNAAKAAAVMQFCVLPDDATLDDAVEVFTELGETHDPVDVVLDKFGAVRWEHLCDMPGHEWWEELELLAITIDAAWDYFEFKPKEI